MAIFANWCDVARGSVLSIDAVSVRIRVLLTLALTLMIYPLVDWPTIDPVSAEGLAEIVNQILIGVLMGFFLQIVTAAVVVGGQAVANAMGLSMATMVDPGLGTVPLMSQFMLILATLIFLGVGGHMLSDWNSASQFRDFSGRSCIYWTKPPLVL